MVRVVGMIVITLTPAGVYSARAAQRARGAIHQESRWFRRCGANLLSESLVTTNNNLLERVVLHTGSILATHICTLPILMAKR